MWIKSSNSDSVKPAEIDRTSSAAVVYVRKDFREVPSLDMDGEQTGTHWEYMENAVPVEDWETYEQVIANKNGIEDVENAVCEESMATDERLSDIENAICELSELIN